MKCTPRTILVIVLLSLGTELECPLQAQTHVAVRLRCDTAQYLAVVNGVLSTSNDRLEPAEFFALVDRNSGGVQSGHSISVRAGNGTYLILGNNPDGEIFASGIAPEESFLIVKVSGGGGATIRSGDAIALRANNGRYVAAPGSSGERVKANQTQIGPSSTFHVELITSPQPSGAVGGSKERALPSESGTAPMSPANVVAIVTGPGATKRNRKLQAAPPAPQLDSSPRPAGPSPAPVSGLTGTATGPTTAVLKWNGPPGAGYLVWRDLLLLTKSPASGTTFTDMGLRPKTTYVYRVAASTTAPGSNPTPGPGPNASAVTVAMPPGVPPGKPIATYVESKAIALTWSPSPNAPAYTVFRNGSPISPVVTATSYTDEQPIYGPNTYEIAAHYLVDSSGQDVWGDKSPPLTLQGPIWGYADTHNHQFSYLGFGGKFVVGQVFDTSSDSNAIKPDAIKRALAHCDFFGGVPVPFDPFNPLNSCTTPTIFHGPWGLCDSVGIGGAMDAGSGIAAHGLGAGGYPEFDMWPRWNSLNHQQEYYQWLKRAHEGGLQLLVMHAVNSEYLCGKMNQLDGFGCYDMASVDRQLDAAQKLEKFIDQQSGGSGTGWYKIVRTASEARNAINNGQLAVLLGIEVADLFGCGSKPKPGCTETYVNSQFQKYYDKGVRIMYPVHVTDNDFGGACIFVGIYEFANLQMRGQIFQTYDCSSEPAPNGPGSTDPGYSLDEDVSIWEKLINGVPGLRLPREKFTCNRNGLTDLGKFLFTTMMKNHMIVDIDHLSYKGINELLTIAENQPPLFPLASNAPPYPAVMSGHSGYLATSVGMKRHEGQKTDDQLTRIQGLGGMVGVLTAQGVTSTSPNSKGGITQYPPPNMKTSQNQVLNDCSKSSKTFAQAYQYAVDKFGGTDKAAVALSTDIMGMIDQPGPRYGPNIYGFDDSCYPDHSSQALDQRVCYPFKLPGIAEAFDRSRACEGPDQNEQTTDCKRTFDFNTDGLAHIGMLPDFVADLRSLGVNTDPLFRSAEHFIEMWERAELWPGGSSPVIPVTHPPGSLYVSLKYDNATPQGGSVSAYAADWNTGGVVEGTMTVGGISKPLGSPVPYTMAAGTAGGFAGDGRYGGLVPPVAVISAPGYTSAAINLAPPTFLVRLQFKRTVEQLPDEPCGDTVNGRGCRKPPLVTLTLNAQDAQTGAVITNGQFTIAGRVAKLGQSVTYMECLPGCVGTTRIPGYMDAQFTGTRQLN